MLSQYPDSSYINGDHFNLSCSAEAWPSQTLFEITANQKTLCVEEVANARDGIKCRFTADSRVHQNLECVARNKMGSSRQAYDILIYSELLLRLRSLLIFYDLKRRLTRMICRSLQETYKMSYKIPAKTSCQDLTRFLQD